MLRREDSDSRLLICVQTVLLSSDVAVSIIKKIKIAKVTRSKRDRVWPEATTLTCKTGLLDIHDNCTDKPGSCYLAAPTDDICYVQDDVLETPMAEPAPTFRSLITAFTDFLTVATHTILYERAVYPQTSFLSAKKYNHIARQNRHPKVCDWITDAMTAVENELLKGGVEKVVIVIFSKDNKALERFVFDVSRFPSVPAGDQDTPLEGSGTADEQASVLPVVDMEEQFRAVMSKLTNCGSSLKPVRPQCTFTIAIELQQDGPAPVSHPQAWIPAQREQDRAPEHQAKRINTPRTTALRSVQAGEMVFETWIEESHEKS